MPHAALWVVQLERTAEISNRLRRFNAARGFVGGAALSTRRNHRELGGFNAARGFVGGAAIDPRLCG